MNTTQIRNEIDALIESTTGYHKEALPASLMNDLTKWHWGSYGWVSPASLMFTATWRKYYYPEIDCCKIWASDENNKPIPGGYSIRSDDEAISIPLLAKHDLCEGFCSPNSGMQGSRAIEKMRSLKRLNRDFDSAQRTLFDLKLFAKILNDINELSHDQLLELLRFFVVISKGIKTKRDEVNKTLIADSESTFDILTFLAETHDPELTKCVVAACLQVIFGGYGISVSGVDDYKTAADARAGKPGDLTVEKNGLPLLAVEVKDKTQKIDWNNIERAKRIISAHTDLKGFVFVLESRDAATNPLINEFVKSSQLATGEGKIISVMSLFALYQLAMPIATETDIVNITGKFLAIAPAVKPETKDAWLKMLDENDK